MKEDDVIWCLDARHAHNVVIGAGLICEMAVDVVDQLLYSISIMQSCFPQERYPMQLCRKS